MKHQIPIIRKSWIVAGAILSLVFIISIFAIDLLIYLSARRPALYAKTPKFIQVPAKRIYVSEVRNAIQFSECSRYDSELFYTLRPGTCRFKNSEFDTSLTINSNGMRDSEIDLTKPEIVVLGDSFAMGFGVQQSDSFPELIQASIGKRVLNTGISSYGTVREMLMFDRVDRSNIKAIIIQYCDNDVGENEKFLRNGSKLRISSELEFKRILDLKEKQTYTPFESIAGKFRFGPPSVKHSPSDQVELFVKILRSKWKQPLPRVPIYVVRFDESRNSDSFLRNLASYRSPDLDLRPINVGRLLNDDDHFALDGHLKPSGHRKVADEIVRVMTQGGTTY